MKCDDVKDKIRDFLEDALSEDARDPVREHLESCVPCEAYAMRLGTYASEIRRMAKLAPPFDLVDAYLNDPEENDLRSEEIVKTVLFITLVVVLAFGFWAGRKYIYHYFRPQTVPAKLPVVIEDQEEASLMMLKLIAARIGAEQSNQPAAEPPPARVGKLQPFHWHLQFDTELDRRIFLQFLHKVTAKPDFESADALVFKADHDSLSKIIGTLSGTKEVRADTVLPKPEKLPLFDEPVRISAAMRLKAEGVKRPTLAHWDLLFALPNRFAFMERLHQQGYHFVYETPEFWVLEMAGDDAEKLREEVRDTNGVTADFGDLTLLTGKPPEKIAIYAREA